ncbi:glycerophosphodiester phosphodiesterase [Pedobacter yulinensis]|uniref:Glycerophosphodiester phosphodiesterase n=1 Tax=Pedobacter yulinensis TaxID=2126353 RepID=A0A2T3HJJ0_9SPHI|nr:glycerophosphodiester phosphodiesterase [Pedobacter yulinensis]PST82618.1 glycerophosphodiester phosphodiesterase [Pedobacter yulinensis]
MRLFKNLFISLLCVFVFKVQASAQAQVKIHSHNDYTHQRPLYEALELGVYSIEADVFLQFDSLVVAHSRKELPAAKGLNEQYLAPLKKYLKGDSLPPVLKPGQLMIDFKDSWQSTYPVLLKTLQPYLALLRRKPDGPGVLLTISGNRPADSTFHLYPDFIYFDGLPFRKYRSRDLRKVVMISDNFKTWSSWNGQGELPEADKVALKKVIADAHLKGKPIRFWNTPDGEDAWRELAALGVDIVNTDKPEACKTFLRAQAKP